MDSYNNPGQRPPRQQRPAYGNHQYQPSDPPGYPQDSSTSSFRPPPQPVYTQSRAGPGPSISFQNTERGDREGHLPQRQQQQQQQQSAYRNTPMSPAGDPERGGYPSEANVLRKKSLVRPDREKIEPGHRQWHYRTHAAHLESANSDLVQPSSPLFSTTVFHVLFIHSFLPP
jgi:chitin synthase